MYTLKTAFLGGHFQIHYFKNMEMVFTKHVYVTCYTNSWYWIITSSLESSYVPYFQCKLMEYISNNSNVQLFCHECDTDHDDVWSQSMTKSKNFFENLEIMEMKYTIYKHHFGRVHFTSIISRFLKKVFVSYQTYMVSSTHVSNSSKVYMSYRILWLYSSMLISPYTTSCVLNA